MAEPATPRPRESITMRRLGDGTVRYDVRVRVGIKSNGRPDQRSKTFKTIAKARAWRAEVTADVSRGVFRSDSKITLLELATSWLESKTDIKSSSRQDCVDHLKPTLDVLGHLAASSITRPMIERVLHDRRTSGGRTGSGVGHSSLRKTLLMIRKVLDYGVDIGAVGKNVAESIPTPKAEHRPGPAFQPWTVDELAAFRSAADQHALAPAWRLSLCGLRRGEVLGLRWADVDLDAGVLSVRSRLYSLPGAPADIDSPKSTASVRTVAFESIQPGTASMLRGLMDAQVESRDLLGPTYNPDGLVVVNEFGMPRRSDYYSKQFASLTRAAALRPVRLHGIRHTLATVMHENGLPPATAAAILGHDVDTHLRTYVTSSDARQFEASSALGQVLNGGAVPA